MENELAAHATSADQQMLEAAVVQSDIDTVKPVVQHLEAELENLHQANERIQSATDETVSVRSSGGRTER